MSPPARQIHFLLTHSGLGGTQEIWANLAAGFARRGDAVRLYALYPHSGPQHAMPPELPWHYLAREKSTGLFRALTASYRLARLLLREKPDVVLSAMPATNVLGPLIGRLVGAKARFILSHHIPVQNYKPLLRRLDSFTGSLANVAAIVCVSEAVRASLHDKPDRYRAKTLTIHNALPPVVEALLETLRLTRETRAPQAHVVATGRLAPEKNYPALIRAVAQLPEARLSIVGAGAEEATLRALAAALGVAERVAFLGMQSRQKTLEILAEADVFAQPSFYEGHSLALLEAAKLGIPLVVSNVPAQREGIAGPDGAPCGLAVPPEDVEALAAALRQCLDNPAPWQDRSSLLGRAMRFERQLAAYLALSESEPPR
jgi:glycosyltransferase involved in cell wall biosynthesis